MVKDRALFFPDEIHGALQVHFAAQHVEVQTPEYGAAQRAAEPERSQRQRFGVSIQRVRLFLAGVVPDAVKQTLRATGAGACGDAAGAMAAPRASI